MKTNNEIKTERTAMWQDPATKKLAMNGALMFAIIYVAYAVLDAFGLNTNSVGVWINTIIGVYVTALVYVKMVHSVDTSFWQVKPSPELNSKLLGVAGWTAIYTTLWALLLIVPGIVKMYAYSQAPVLLIEDYKNNRELKPAQWYVTKSKEMMQGKKGQLFGLNIGWYTLWFGSYLLFGLGLSVAINNDRLLNVVLDFVLMGLTVVFTRPAIINNAIFSKHLISTENGTKATM